MPIIQHFHHLILFHSSGYRCLKHFYLEKGSKSVAAVHAATLLMWFIVLFFFLKYKVY